jgi:hypothetical protein
MSDNDEIKLKRAAYMRKWYADNPGYNSWAQKKYRANRSKTKVMKGIPK